MSQIQTVIIKDGATTPVDHTFTPVTPQFGNSPAEWREKNVSIRLGDKVLMLSTVIGNTGTRKTKGSMALPEIATIDGKPQIIGISRFNFEVITPEGVNLQSVKDTAAFFKNFASLAIVQAAIVDGEIVY